MHRGLEEPEVAPVRVLAVGSSTWLRAAAPEIDDGDVAIRGPIDPETAREESRLEAADCVFTDDRDVLESIDGAVPVLYATDPADDEPLDWLDAEETVDVIAKSAVDRPSILAHRLRRTAQFAAARRTVSRQAARFRALIEQSSDLVVVADADGRITDVGPSVEDVGGYDAEEMLDTHFLEYVHPEDASAVRAEFDDLCDREPGATTTVEYRCQHADGAWYVHEAVLTNRLDDGDGDGNGDGDHRVESQTASAHGIDGIVASIRDVTEYHQVERELDESFERVSDAFYALDSQWRFVYVNEQAASSFDVEPSDVIGRNILELFPELRDTSFHEVALEAMDAQEQRSLERYYEPTGRWYDVQFYPSPSGLSVYFRDVTERVERERELEERTERLETLVQNVPIVLFAFDADGTITLADGRALERIEGVSDDIVGETVFDAFADQDDILADARTALDGEPTHSLLSFGESVFETWCRPIVIDDTVERVIGTGVDVTERVQYEDALNALHEATSHLLTVESEQAACEYMVDVASDVLDLETVVYRFDDQQNELVPAAYSQGLESAVGSPPRLQPGESITWQTFVSGTPSLVEDLGDSDRVPEAVSAARSGLYVPIGEHGALVSLAPEPDRYDRDTFELTQLFAATAEAALDRIARTRRLHGRERELKRQNIHLERLNEASRVRQHIEQLLLMADSREEIERGICERLADHEACSFAWIGEPDPGGTQIDSQASDGRERGYLDAVSVTTVDDPAAEPTGRAARTRSPVYVENVADSIRDGTWRVEALSRNYQSAYAVPLVYDDFLYGVLTIYGDDRDAFHEPFRSMLAELGETIGYAIDAVKRKAALREGDAEIELELELESDGESPLCRLADHLDARIEYEGAALRPDGSPTVFVATDGTVTDDRAAEIVTVPGIDGVSVIAETDAETLLQLQCTEPFLGSVVDSHGGTLRTFVVDGSERRAVVDVPETIEIRDVVSGLNRRGFDASMVARREQPSSDGATVDASARNALLDRLTDRQREVVQTAYHGGFFEWPRQTNGEAIADSLEISSPAFHKHVRAAERKLFTTLFDGSSSSG